MWDVTPNPTAHMDAPQNLSREPFEDSLVCRRNGLGLVGSGSQRTPPKGTPYQGYSQDTFCI